MVLESLQYSAVSTRKIHYRPDPPAHLCIDNIVLMNFTGLMEVYDNAIPTYYSAMSMQSMPNFTTHNVTPGFVQTGLKILALGSLLLVAGCSDSSDNPPGNVSAGDPLNGSDTSEARYRLTFNASWSETTHPVNFPANPHFSGLVGAVHNEQIRFWEPGQIATAGIVSMAETGSKSTFLTEVGTAIDNGFALAEISGGGIATSPESTSVEFDVSRDYPQISITSMLAPSPDWFIGLHNYPLIESGEFIESSTIELNLYDSGSDNGLRYTSANDPADPQAPISTVTSDPQNSPFIDGKPIVGTIVIERISTP